MVERANTHAQLRREVLVEQQSALEHRRRTNPLLSTDEQLIGMYTEAIEPQVRGAVFDLNRKGYPTFSSGFYDFDSRYQAIEGKFVLDDTVVDQIASLDVEIISGPVDEFISFPTPEDQGYITIIQFRTGTDLTKIEAKWNSIASLIPPRLYKL